MGQRLFDDSYGATKEIVEDHVQYVNSFMEIESLKKIESINKLLSNYMPVGKDLVLSNLKDDIDRAKFMIYYRQIVSLIAMQKRKFILKGKSVPDDVVMLQGVLPSIEHYSIEFQGFIITTRASGGANRERELHLRDHAAKAILASQKKPNISDYLLGETRR